MLMESKAYLEASRALCIWGGLQVDLSQKARTEDERQQADDLISLLTPVIKGYVTDLGYQIATQSQQVYGGHGYIREWGMEQYVRDARIAQIYEGTNGIQAMDLVGRKLAQNGGRAIQAFLAMVGEEVAERHENESVNKVASALEKVNAELRGATMWLMQNAFANLNHAGAAAYPYMQLMGISALGLMWLRMAKASSAAIEEDAADKAFHEAKLVTARFFAERMMPDAGGLRAKIEGGSDSLMALEPEMFVAA